MLGTPDEAHELLEDYYGTLPSSLLTDDTNALLGALLLELQAQRLEGGGPNDLGLYLRQREQSTDSAFNREARGVYKSLSVDIQANDYTEITPSDLGFVTQEVDLRNANIDIEVAFTQPGSDSASLTYTTEEIPVTGIPVSTAKIWVRVADSATSNQGTVTIDCWSRN